MKPPVGYRPPPESDLIDEIMLATGKALYLANSLVALGSEVPVYLSVLRRRNDPLPQFRDPFYLFAYRRLHLLTAVHQSPI
jgi:hypothetical protein